MEIFEEWAKFLQENWMWFIPVVASFSGPIIASLINILYDYLKMKGLIKY